MKGRDVLEPWEAATDSFEREDVIPTPHRGDDNCEPQRHLLKGRLTLQSRQAQMLSAMEHELDDL